MLQKPREDECEFMKKEDVCVPPFPIIEELPEDMGKRTLRLLQVFQRLHRVNLAEKIGISKGEFITLQILADYHKEYPEEEGVYVSYIAKKQGVANSQISRLLKGLEEEGLIGRKVAKEDRRNTYVFLSDRGRQLLEDIKKRMESSYCQVMEKFGEENTEELIRLCTKIADIMEEEF